jgi:hypothetical protein
LEAHRFTGGSLSLKLNTLDVVVALELWAAQSR